MGDQRGRTDAGPSAAYEVTNAQQATGYLVEEAGEMLAAVGKSIRWGFDSVNPELPPAQQETNRDWALRELADLEAAAQRFRAFIDVGPEGAPDRKDGAESPVADGATGRPSEQAAATPSGPHAPERTAAEWVEVLEAMQRDESFARPAAPGHRNLLAATERALLAALKHNSALAAYWTGGGSQADHRARREVLDQAERELNRALSALTGGE